MELLTPEFSLMFWGILGIVVLLIWLMALISIIKADFKDATSKLIWIIVVIFIPLIGSILYFLIGRNQRISNY